MELFRIIKNGKYGYVNELGQEIIACKYKLSYPLGNDLYACMGDSNKWGIVSKTGVAITPIIYDKFLTDFYRKEYIIVRKDNNSGVLDIKGKEVVSCEYEDVIDVLSKFGYFVVIKNNRYGIVDQEGKKVFQTKFEFIAPAGKDTFEFRKGKKAGLMNLSGDIILEPGFDRIEVPYDNVIIARKAGKWGCYDLQGTGILPFEYDNIYKGYIYQQNAPWLILEQGGKKGMFMLDSHKVLQCNYDEIEALPPTDQFIEVKIGRKWGLIDRDFNQLLACEYSEIDNRFFDNGEMSSGTYGYPISIKKRGKYGTYDPFERRIVEECIYDRSILRKW